MELGEFLLGRAFVRAIRWLGGATRFVYGSLIRSLGLTRRRRFRLREYIHGPDKPDDPAFDSYGHQFVNTVIGFLTLALLLGVTLGRC